MAAQNEDHTAFDEEDEDLDDTDADDSDMDDDGDDDAVAAGSQPPPAIISDLNAAAVSTQPPKPNLHPPADPAPVDLQTATPDLKRPRIEERLPPPPPAASTDESRRLFQRLWTDDDEIKILKGFLAFTASRGTQFASHQYDTGPFYDQIKNELQLDFNKNQLIEKLRRLKKKYRNTANRMANHGKDFTFKSPHEKATYDIARKIWSASVNTSRDSDDDVATVSSDRKISRSRRRSRSRKRNVETLPVMLPPPLEDVVRVEVQTTPVVAAPITTTTPILPPPVTTPVVPIPSATPIPTVIEETVKSCLSPIFKELLNSAVSAPLGLGVNLPPLLNFGGSLTMSDERWKKQQILELEVYLKRVELVRDQIKLMLEEMKESKPAAESATRGYV